MKIYNIIYMGIIKFNFLLLFLILFTSLIFNYFLISYTNIKTLIAFYAFLFISLFFYCFINLLITSTKPSDQTTELWPPYWVNRSAHLLSFEEIVWVYVPYKCLVEVVKSVVITDDVLLKSLLNILLECSTGISISSKLCEINIGDWTSPRLSIVL